MTDFAPPAFMLAQTTGQPVQPAGMPNAQPVAATPGSPTTGTPGAPAGGSSPFGSLGMMLPLILIAGLFIVTTFWTQRKDKKKREELMNSMKKGDKVQTYGGIVGTIAELTDTEAVIRVEEGRIRFARSAIQTVLSSKGSTSVEPKDTKADSKHSAEHTVSV